MIIYWTGSTLEINLIRKRLSQADTFSFKEIKDLDAPADFKEAGLFLITPSVDDPIKLVHKVARKDKFLSIVVLVEALRYHQLRKAIQFSLHIGKTTTCVAFSENSDYFVVFHNAIARTRQKRTFNAFKLGSESKLSQLTAASTKLENLGNILEFAPIGAILMNKEFTVIGANKTSRDMFEQLSDGPVPLSMVFPFKQFETITKHMLDNNEQVLSITDADGNYFDISAFRFSQEGTDKYILLINDVTERKLKDKRVEDILESLPQIAWTTSPEGQVTFFSQGWYQYTNLTASQSMGDQWIAAVHPDDLPKLTKRWQEAIRDGKRYQQASRFRRLDGEYRWHLTRAVPLYTQSGKVMMWVGTSTDIHEQILLTENLERKVKERTRVLEEKNAELEQFAYISSHDLQEPLRKIQTFAHILRDEGTRLPADTFDRYIGKIITTSGRMSRLIKDLLNFTRIDQREEPQLLDLNDVIYHILEDLEVVINQNGAKIQSGDLPVIQGRALQIKQLFYNIITNSIKFRKPETPPRISITSRLLDHETSEKTKHLFPGTAYHEIIIKDNGIGFDQKYADQIFTVFQRLHTKTAYEGTGIGLSIAKKVITNHGGDIFALSTPGEGSEFHLILPQTNIDSESGYEES